MLRTDFHYELPPELIAQVPTAKRDGSRLLVLNRHDGSVAHRQFTDFPRLLRPGDVLCLNDSKVLHARLHGVRVPTGGAVELLLLEEVKANQWWAMLRPGKRLHPGSEFVLTQPTSQRSDWVVRVLDKNESGHCLVQFFGDGNILDVLDQIGEVPLPPYIERSAPAANSADRERYQTVYAARLGSVAAPTAGLHLTSEILEVIRSLGVEVVTVTLHVGAGTFVPMKTDRLDDHQMHSERYEVGVDAASAIQRAKREGRRVVAVGTTTCRVLETAARSCAPGAGVGSNPGSPHGADIQAGRGRTQLFLYPPSNFQIVDALLTNFHLPESTLLMLVSAFAAPGQMHGRERILSAYAEAVRERYRFFSYGDAMFIQ